MNKNKKLWIGVISLVLAFLMFSVLFMIQKSMQEKPVCAEVICVKDTVSQNMVITEQNVNQYFERKNIPVDWLPSDYISNMESLHEMVIGTKLSAGTIMTKSMVTEHREYYKGYQNLTWISVPIKELYEGVAGSLRVGDYIDIYMLCKENEEYRCSLLAEQIRVEATYSDNGTFIEEDSQEGLSQLIIIPMEREQVALFYEILAQGNIRIAKYEAV